MKDIFSFEMHLLDLPGDDVILKIMDFLSPRDWLNFRCVCKQTYFLVHEYFKYMKYLDLSHHKVLPQALCQVGTDASSVINIILKIIFLIADFTSAMSQPKSFQNTKLQHIQ